MMGEDKGHQIVLCWDARTAQANTPLNTGAQYGPRLKRETFKSLTLSFAGHLGTLQFLSHSPTAPAFITCSTDSRIRFFYYKDQQT